MYDEKFFENMRKIDVLFKEGKIDAKTCFILSLLNGFDWYEREKGVRVTFDSFLLDFVNNKF